MHYANIILTLGWGGLLLSAMMLIPLGWAIHMHDTKNLLNFIGSFLISSFISLTFIIACKQYKKIIIKKSDLFLLSGIFFLFLPIQAALPFINYEHNINFWSAYFEAVSGLTTTGASIFNFDQQHAQAILLWRALLGWVGGLFILCFYMSVIAPLGLLAVDMKFLNIRQNENETIIQRLTRALKQITPLYITLTVTGIIIIYLYEKDLFQAICLPLSAISTTGFSFDNMPLSQTLSLPSLLTISLLMFLGAMSYPLLLLIKERKFYKLKQDYEFRQFYLFILITSLVILLFSEDKTHLLQSIISAINAITSSAFHIYTIQETETAILAIIYFSIIIGGMSLSTSGGLKILPVSLLLKRCQYETLKPQYPNSIDHMQYGNRYVKNHSIISIGSFFVLFVITFFITFLLASLWSDNLIQSTILTIGMVTNTGGINLLTGDTNLYTNLPSIGFICFSIIMIVARLEFIIIIILLSPTYWLNRN